MANIEVDERIFYKALLQYFNKREKQCTALDNRQINAIVGGLIQLLNGYMAKPGYRKGQKVHVKHVFREVGFKIE